MRQPISVVYNCDCKEFMRARSDGQFDLSIVDPPYGILTPKMPYAFREIVPVKQKNGGRLNVKKRPYEPQDWDNKFNNGKWRKYVILRTTTCIIWVLINLLIFILGSFLVTAYHLQGIWFVIMLFYGFIFRAVTIEILDLVTGNWVSAYYKCLIK